LNDNNSRGSGWLAEVIQQVLMGLTRLPKWAVPAVIGAALMFIITALRGLIMLIAAQPTARMTFAFLLALVVATVAGAAAGLIYTVSRMVLRSLGLLGDALTGVIGGSSYVLAVLVPAKYVLGDATLDTPSSWIIACAFGSGFGLVCTILYWYYRRRVS